MKIVEPKYEILTDISEGGIKELQQIERVARVCYKSEDKITPDGESAKKLVGFLVKQGHEAMIFVFITPLEKTAFATFAPVLWFVLKKTSMASLKLVGFITLAKLEPIISSYVTVLMAAKCIGLLLPAFTGVSIPYQIVNKQ